MNKQTNCPSYSQCWLYNSLHFFTFFSLLCEYIQLGISFSTHEETVTEDSDDVVDVKSKEHVSACTPRALCSIYHQLLLFLDSTSVMMPPASSFLPPASPAWTPPLAISFSNVGALPSFPECSSLTLYTPLVRCPPSLGLNMQTKMTLKFICDPRFLSTSPQLYGLYPRHLPLAIHGVKYNILILSF